jgi:hypothetical protein
MEGFMSGPAKRPRLRVESLEDRSNPAFGPAGHGLSIAIGDVNANATGNEYVIGAGIGDPPVVKIYDTSGNLLSQFNAYESTFTGGVNVAVGDINGDGKPEIITGPGAGGAPLVEAFDPSTGRRMAAFFAYEASFRGGVYVAAGNVNGAGPDEIVTGVGVGGGPVVGVFNNRGIRLNGFFADEPAFRGGVTVAVADTNGDNVPDIVTGTGPGGGPVVRVFGFAGNQLASFFAFDPTNRDGVTVAAGDTDGRVPAEIYATPSANSTGALPVVRIYNGSGRRIGGDVFPYTFPGATNVLNMAVGDVDADTIGDLAIVPGDMIPALNGVPQVSTVPRVFLGAQNSQAGLNGP